MRRVMLIASVALMALTGCTTYYAERNTQDQVSLLPQSGPYYRSEWQISDTRTKALGTARVWFGFLTSGEPKYADVPGLNLPFFPTDRAIYRAKSAATYNACEQTKADALLGVAYKYMVTNYLIFSTVECEVVGYPARVAGMKLLEDHPVLVDDTTKVIRIKPWETLTDCSSAKKNAE